MGRFITIIGEGVEKSPDLETINDFWEMAKSSIPSLSGNHEIRSIGIDSASTEKIFEYIVTRQKVGTFTLPWLNDKHGVPAPIPGLPVILLSFNGDPRIIIRITEVFQTVFGKIDQQITALDGPPVRDLSVWLPMHRKYWNAALTPYELACTDDMPVTVEKFEPVFTI